MALGREAAISLRDVRKTFDGRDYVLDGLNLEIPKGLITVIIGYSGTGKSVLLKHVLGLLRPTSGEVNVLGQDLWQMSDQDLMLFRRNLGVLFQYAALFDDMTVLENVCFPLKEHRRDMAASDIIQVAVEKLTASGMAEKHFHKLPAELSGGMRKRVGLARALALDPQIILYDEPTTGLDPVLTEMVDDLIAETHHRQKGGTSLIVSHDLFAAFRLGQNLVMLDKGRVLLQGTPEDFEKSNVELVQRFIQKGIKRR